MAENVTYEVMNRAGMLKFAEDILTGVNNRIVERIVQTVDETSDDKHVASAKAVYNAIAAVKTTKLVPYTGVITDIADPKSDVIYLQRDNEADTTWMMYVYSQVEKTTPSEVEGEEPTVEMVNQWIAIGSTEISLDNYWSKDEVDGLKAALGINDLVTSVDEKVSASQMVAYTDQDITDIVASAFANTEILNPTPAEPTE